MWNHNCSFASWASRNHHSVSASCLQTLSHKLPGCPSGDPTCTLIATSTAVPGTKLKAESKVCKYFAILQYSAPKCINFTIDYHNGEATQTLLGQTVTKADQDVRGLPRHRVRACELRATGRHWVDLGHDARITPAIIPWWLPTDRCTRYYERGKRTTYLTRKKQTYERETK